MNFIKRDLKGRFVSTKTKVKFAAFILFTVGTLAVGHLYVEPMIDRANEETRKVLDKVSTEISYVAAPKVEAAEVESDIVKAKEKTIDILEKCESAGHGWDEGFIKMDTNNKLSYGPLQWQKDTVKHYIEKRDHRKITGLEAVEIAMDREKSRDLAAWVIFEDKGVDSDWVICSKNYGIQSRVDIIKELE